MTKLRIVVADDDDTIRDLVTDILEEAGYRIEAFSDGLSALDAVRGDPPAVALFDIAMPVMTGDDVLRKMRAEGINIPVVVMTAGTHPQRFLEMGAAAVVPKPFNLEELLRVITSVRAPPPYLREVALGEGLSRKPYTNS